MKAKLLRQIIALTQQVVALLRELYIRKLPKPNQKILRVCYKREGTDVAPIYDEFGCAEAVNAIVTEALGHPVGGDVSTYRMYKELRSSNKFKLIYTPIGGDIILSPTGYGNGNITNGHVGIFADGNQIFSNDSASGNFVRNYTLKEWRGRYEKGGGFPVLFYRVIE